jgi:hypothetical protein
MMAAWCRLGEPEDGGGSGTEPVDKALGFPTKSWMKSTVVYLFQQQEWFIWYIQYSLCSSPLSYLWYW